MKSQQDAFQIVTELIKEKRITIAMLSSGAKIPYDRVYKWFSPKAKAKPKPEDLQKIQDWLREMELIRESWPRRISPEDISYEEQALPAKDTEPTHPPPSSEDYRDKYDKLKDKLLAMYEKHNDQLYNLAMSKEELVKEIREVKGNLAIAADRQQIFRVMSNARSQVTLETLAKMNGLHKDELVNTANSIGDVLLHYTDDSDTDDFSDSLSK